MSVMLLGSRIERPPQRNDGRGGVTITIASNAEKRGGLPVTGEWNAVEVEAHRTRLTSDDISEDNSELISFVVICAFWS